MAKAKEVVEPAIAAEVPPAATAQDAPKARIVTFWSASLRTVKLKSGEVIFKTNRITLTDEKLIEELSAICGDKSRIWLQSEK